MENQFRKAVLEARVKFGDDSATAVHSLAPERVDFDLDCEAYKVFTSHQAAAFPTDSST